MIETYALTIGVESYEYDGEFYIVGEGHRTPSEVLQHVAGNHILLLDQIVELLDDNLSIDRPFFTPVNCFFIC
ncbi:hypothetical protein SAMN05192561_105158 [Halopenitus malekzadehii]|uniref:Uncharacterized protein n=1 Tax=Halopenitus malekzadehii TaxID=1267564 RepID=A0A1H6J412_9EURY|nr:hypothetical protein SAMN05192561_105158 [Halopenitus malekzadehii]